MGLGKFVAGALEVGTGFLDVSLELLVHAMQALIVIKVLVLDLGVLLPGIRCGTLHADMEAMVLEHAGKRAG